MKRAIKNGTIKILIIAIAVLSQAFITYSIYHWFYDKIAWITVLLQILGLIITIYIVRHSKHLSFDMIWILLIMAFPVVGTILYLLLGADQLTSSLYRQLTETTQEAKRYYIQNKKVMDQLKKEDPDAQSQLKYISNYGYPVYQNTGFRYYPSGEAGFPAMLKDLKKAEKFIFLEFFIIDEGTMWDQILAILEEKVKEGVDVRLLYDYIGSFFQLPINYYRRLEAMGIKCVPFNQVNPILNFIVNHRDHRKIMVIDGKVAYSGGINLADEYINAKVVHGYWKDNIIRITGEAVWSYTVMFLTHFNALRKTDNTYLAYKVIPVEGKNDGFIAPYGETPLDDEIGSQNIYMNIINQAKKYCYISTPYLIIDTDMINALILCAKRGVDVRIIVPGIPDKKTVYKVTSSYFGTLIDGGVRIFTYTPGFNHGKVFVADDKIATVGTVNLDYRSLYLHFENGTYLYNSKEIRKIHKDLLEMMEWSHEVSAADATYSIFTRIIQSILRLIAPMM